MKISVITPSVRPEMLEILFKCLRRQTFKDFEWVIIGPENVKNHILFQYEPGLANLGVHIVPLLEPAKKDGDYYSLNKAWNEAFKYAQGELIISIQDGLWFSPDMLEKFWIHYQNNPKALVGAIGHQYEQLENGKPEHRVWSDPRSRTDFGSFYEVGPREIEYCIASIPKQALLDVGGIDEEFDKYAALSEKEMNYRMEKAGYIFYLDQSIEYRAIKHPRLSDQWDTRYLAGCEYYDECLKQIFEGKRLKLNYFP